MIMKFPKKCQIFKNIQHPLFLPNHPQTSNKIITKKAPLLIINSFIIHYLKAPEAPLLIINSFIIHYLNAPEETLLIINSIIINYHRTITLHPHLAA